MSDKALRYMAVVMLAAGILLLVASMKGPRHNSAQELTAVPTANGQPWSTGQDVKVEVVSAYEIEVIR